MAGKKRARGAALCLAAVLALSGCGQEENVVYKTETLPQNDGRPARLTVEVPGGLEGRGEIGPVMEEIVRKYQGDYPQTEVRLVPEGSPGAQEADIRVVDSGSAGDEAGELLDFSIYADAWYTDSTPTNVAGMVMHYMGRQGVYAVPVDVQQDLMFYRTDWISAYNPGKPWEEQANLETWDRAGLTPLLMGEQGRLAISGDKMSDLFCAVMWSVAGVHTASAPYYFPSKDGLSATTVFAAEKAPSALLSFQRLMGSGPEGGYPDEDAAIRAFIDGEAGILIANAGAVEEISAAMPEDSWQVAGLPAGTSSKCAFVPCRWVGWGIGRETEEPEKAVHFLAYLTNADNNTHMAKECGTLPIYREATTMEPSLLEGPRATEMALLREGSYRYACTPYCLEDFCGEEQPFAAQLEQFLSGGIEGEELLARLDALCLERLDSLRPGWPLPWLEAEDEA